MANNTTLLNQTKTQMRRTRHAYMGAIGYGYDFAVARFQKRRTQLQSLFSDALTKGQEIETDSRQLFDRAKAEVEDMGHDAVAEVEETISETKEALQDLKEEIVEKADKAAARAEKIETIEADDNYSSYLEKVRNYDKAADPIVIKKIVDHLGIALQSRDSMFVACSDEDERKTVADSWLRKKLGVKGDDATLDKKVAATCETMKADRLKDRVTFYYLAAKAENKLSDI